MPHGACGGAVPVQGRVGALSAKITTYVHGPGELPAVAERIPQPISYFGEMTYDE
jgi:hypothetical protein